MPFNINSLLRMREWLRLLSFASHSNDNVIVCFYENNMFTQQKNMQLHLQSTDKISKKIKAKKKKKLFVQRQ